jgi:hypothetical protein
LALVELLPKKVVRVGRVGQDDRVVRQAVADRTVGQELGHVHGFGGGGGEPTGEQGGNCGDD